jgi:signal peptidase
MTGCSFPGRLVFFCLNGILKVKTTSGEYMSESKYTTDEQIESMRREITLEKQLLACGAIHKGKTGKLRQKRSAMKILGWVVFVAMVSALASAIFMVQAAKSRGEVPGFLGYHLFSIESGSMEPTLNVGTVILSRTSGHPDKLGKDTIVTFKTLSGYIVTHRIIEVRTGSDGNVLYRTKGDNPVNSPDEELLSPTRVIAVFVAKIPLT